MLFSPQTKYNGKSEAKVLPQIILKGSKVYHVKVDVDLYGAYMLMDRARRLGYYSPDAPTFDDLCDNADDELFSKALLWSNHVLHALLPPLSAASQRYNLRQRPHSLQLTEHTTQLSDCNFLIRLLYKNTHRLLFLCMFSH